MRAVMCRELGPVDALVVEDLADPEPDSGQTVVAVAAAGLNYVDALFVQGQYQIKPTPPFVPGSEIAGTVVARGDGVADVEIGDRVMANVGLGGFAEQVVVPAEQLVAVPEGISLEAASAFTQSYCTALFSLRERAGLRAGETVLVLGAAGGVGRACIDVAKALGARVVAAASSPERLDRARAAGADETIDYSREDLKSRARELSDGGVDVVVDPVGGDLAEPALRALGYDGRFLVVGFAGGGIPSLPANQILLRNRRVVGVDWGAWMLAHGLEQRALLEELLAMAGAGELHPPEPTTYPLVDAATALSNLVSRRVVGKAALVP